MPRKRITQPHPEIAALLIPHVVALGGTVRSRADFLGVSRTVLHRYERAERIPTVEDLETIANRLGFRLALVKR